MLAYVCPSCLCNYIVQFSGQNVPGDDYGPRLLPGLCGSYFMEEHNHKCFKPLPRSLRIVYERQSAKWPHEPRLCLF